MKFSLLIITASLLHSANAFTITHPISTTYNTVSPPSFSTTTQLHHGPPSNTAAEQGFLATELRSAAMKLHTTAQAPKEGGIKVSKPKPYATTQLDYLKFLVDSQHVYQAFEQVLQYEELQPELTPFVDTGLERSDRLEVDIDYLCSTYDLERPAVGGVGTRYAQSIMDMGQGGKESIPQLMNHYYNHYFAHTAGGIMIGKQMAKQLLDSKTLEFYKWDSDINELKVTVKNSIEELVATWTREQKDVCVDATAAAFQGGGSLNSYLGGGSGE